VAKVFAIAKEGLVAYRVGTAPELDAFLLAYAFPTFVLGALSGSLATAFVPVYVRTLRNKGEGAAARLTLGVSWVLVGALIVAVLVCTPLFSWLIVALTRSYDENTVRLSVSILTMLMPVLVLNGLAGFWSGFLNARQHFVVAALAPTLTPMCVGLALLFLWSELGIYAMVVGSACGACAELALVGGAAIKSGLSVGWYPRAWQRGETGILRQFLAAAAGNALLGCTLLVDQAMAATLEPGSVAALSFGTRVPAVLAGTGAMALATVLLPHLSELLAQLRFGELRTLLRQYSVSVLAVSIAITGAIVAFSQPIVNVLFERGSFGSDDTRLVSSVQAVYALHIPFLAWSLIAARLLSAMHANHFLAIGAVVSLALNVVLNWQLSIRFGVVGIALATVCVYAVSAGYLWIVAIRRLRRADQGVSKARIA